MFHVFRKILDSRHPRRRFGFLFGGAIVFAGMTIFSPATQTLAARGEEPPALPACADQRQTAELYRQLRERYVDLRKETLALERERDTLSKHRDKLVDDIETFEKLRGKVDERLSEWEQRQDTARLEKLDRLVAIVGQMSAPKAAELLSGADADLTVEVIFKLSEQHAGQIIARLPADRAAKVTAAVSKRR